MMLLSILVSRVICNVSILSDPGNINFGTYDSFADAALIDYIYISMTFRATKAFLSVV